MSDEQAGSSESSKNDVVNAEVDSSRGFAPELFKHFEISEESRDGGKVLLDRIQEYFRMLCEANQRQHLERFFR